jgi:hypothetical protein
MRHRFSPNGVISLGMIRLENYTTRLGYFILMKCPKEAFHEFNAVCRNVLAGQLDDLCAGDCTRLAEMVNVPAAAIRRCRLQGYDLTTKDGGVVPSWQAFAVLILAKAEGLIPSVSALRKERAMAIRADDMHSLRCIRA